MRLMKGLSKSCAFLFLTIMLATRVAASPKYQVLHDMNCATDGCGIWGTLTLDGSGNLRGAASGGPGNNYGAIFELASGPGGSWSYRLLHVFSDYHTDGEGPNGELVFDPVGNLYGTAGGGGANDEGTIFELVPGSGGWSFSVLYNFGTRYGDGSSPQSGMVMDSSGNLYGVAGGRMFELSPGSGGWTEKVLYTFCPNCTKGSSPIGPAVLDSTGNLYGTTGGGGKYNGCPNGSGCGVAYELRRPPKGRWKEAVLYTFQAGRDGFDPSSGLTFDQSGNLYGVTALGGGHGCYLGIGCGTVFKLTPKSRGGWKESVIHSFGNGRNGNYPFGTVALDKAGNLYGVTAYGGSGCGCGVIYKLSPGPKGKWTYTIEHSFTYSDGAEGGGGLIIDNNGNLYGGTGYGGAYGEGVIFELTP